MVFIEILLEKLWQLEVRPSGKFCVITEMVYFSVVLIILIESESDAFLAGKRIRLAEL